MFLRFALAILGAATLAAAPPTDTLSRIRETGKLTFGFRTDARPFSYRDMAGIQSGYSIALCDKIGAAAKRELGMPNLSIQWVPVTIENRVQALRSGTIDLLCGADTITLARRAEVAFSIPIFPGGIGALIRTDASGQLRDALADRPRPTTAVWRAHATQALQSRDFSFVVGTTAEPWLAERMRTLQVIARVAPVETYDAGVQRLRDRQSDVFFGERAILLSTASHAIARDVVVLDRLFTYEPVALTLRRGDEDFRLLVDRTLARLYRSDEIGDVYMRSFGVLDESARTFFRWNAVPDGTP
jgi:ABC-type amino acid transport substrate-binding protein